MSRSVAVNPEILAIALISRSRRQAHGSGESSSMGKFVILQRPDGPAPPRNWASVAPILGGGVVQRRTETGVSGRDHFPFSVGQNVRHRAFRLAILPMPVRLHLGRTSFARLLTGVIPPFRVVTCY